MKQIDIGKLVAAVAIAIIALVILSPVLSQVAGVVGVVVSDPLGSLVAAVGLSTVLIAFIIGAGLVFSALSSL